MADQVLFKLEANAAREGDPAPCTPAERVNTEAGVGSVIKFDNSIRVLQHLNAILRQLRDRIQARPP